MSAELTLGAFDLIGGDGNGWKVETLAEGMSFGSAAGRDVVIQTLLQDGAAISRDGYDNREVTFSVVITASDSLGLAQGEAALAAEIGRRNELVWTPPDNWGPPSVFVVVMSSMQSEFNDWGEMESATYGRRFVLSFVCKPFAQSRDRVVVAAVGGGVAPPAETKFLVDSCDVVGGWAAVSPNTTLVAAGGQIRYQQAAQFTGSDQVVSASRTGVIDTSATPYLLIDVVPIGCRFGVPPSIVINGGTSEIKAAASGASPDIPGATRLWFPIPVSTVTSFVLSAVTVASPFTARTIWVEAVYRTNREPFIGTGRQQFRSLTVTGSARTEGSLQIAHETSALGITAVYTNRDDGSGYQPACRQYRTAGAAVSADSTTASGSSSLLNGGTPETYDIPSRAVPEGTYAPMARLKATTPGYYTVTLIASLLSGAFELGSVTISQIVNVTSTWAMYELGSLSLPTVAVPSGSLAKVRLELSAGGAVEVDDTYIFNTTIGALSIVDCGTGTPAPGGASNRLWIDTASLDVPRPAMWVGTQTDRSDAHHVEGSKIQSEMPHRFPPGPVNLFTVSDALYVAASLDFPPNWHSNAAS